jgi:hypothetical protein
MELNWLLRASQRAVRRYLSLASTLEVQIDISRIYNSNRWAAVQEKRPPGVRGLRLGLPLDRREPARSMATSAGSVRINALACRRALRRRGRGNSGVGQPDSILDEAITTGSRGAETLAVGWECALAPVR